MRNQIFYDKIKSNWDSLLKPLDALGCFEEISSQMGALIQDETLSFKPALMVFCADNGIIAEGVSQSDESVTFTVTKLLGQRKSSVCHMAKKAGVEVFPVNLGVKLSSEIEGVDNRCYITAGTKNFLYEPAMTTDEMRAAIEVGHDYVTELYHRGYNTFLLGEMGIGNTTTATAVLASFLDVNISDICGRGSGLDDKGLERKSQVITEAINRYQLKEAGAFEVLAAVGGYDIAAMVGVILKANELGLPVILDGVITCAAAVVAYNIDQTIAEILVFSHKGRENGIMLCADFFHKKPVIDGNLALGEGTGAVVFYDALQVAISVYKGNTTFESANVEAYRRFL